MWLSECNTWININIYSWNYHTKNLVLTFTMRVMLCVTGETDRRTEEYQTINNKQYSLCIYCFRNWIYWMGQVGLFHGLWYTYNDVSIYSLRTLLCGYGRHVCIDAHKEFDILSECFVHNIESKWTLFSELHPPIHS